MDELNRINFGALSMIDHLHSLAPKIAAGAVILFAFWAAGMISGFFTGRISRRLSLPPEVSALMSKAVRVLFIIIGIITALGTVGINISAMVAALGLSGFALGFALRDTVSNVAAGMLVLIYRPFRAGDRIGVLAFEGDVISIDLRYTKIRMENKNVLIPNSTLFSTPVNVFFKIPG